MRADETLQELQDQRRIIVTLRSALETARPYVEAAARAGNPWGQDTPIRGDLDWIDVALSLAR